MTGRFGIWTFYDTMGKGQRTMTKSRIEFIDVTNEDLKGQWSVFCFYPADFSFVCPTELEDLQEQYAALKELGVEVYSPFWHLNILWHHGQGAKDNGQKQNRTEQQAAVTWWSWGLFLAIIVSLFMIFKT